MSARLSCWRNSAAPGSAFKVSIPPCGPSIKRMGLAIRAVSSPAISHQCKISEGSENPAREKMRADCVRISSWIGRGLLPRTLLSGSVRLRDAIDHA